MEERIWSRGRVWRFNVENVGRLDEIKGEEMIPGLCEQL